MSLSRLVPIALAGAAVLGGVFIASVPTEFPDRLARIPDTTSVIDNISPYDSEAKWAFGGAQTGLYVMNPARVDYFKKHLTTGANILDVGCGAGIVSNALAQHSFNVSGIDMSQAAINAASNEAARRDLQCRFAVGSAYALPFPDGVFDGVVASDVLEHFSDLTLAIREIHRVLKPGGKLVFDTINRTWMSYIIAILLGEKVVGLIPPNGHDWRLFITPAELRQAMSGFFAAHDVHGFEPEFRTLVELLFFQMGVLSKEGLQSGFLITDNTMASYIGSATKV